MKEKFFKHDNPDERLFLTAQQPNIAAGRGHSTCITPNFPLNSPAARFI
jgi:hypothetical protein